MSQPTLGPVEQKMFLDDIAAQIMETLPPGWRQLVVLFDRLGRAGSYAARLTRADGAYELPDLPAETLKSFDRLRAGMHVDGRGTWFSCRFSLVPDRWDVQYNRTDPPKTNEPPTPEDFALEQQRFPRNETDMPDWYRAGLGAGTAP